MAVDPGVVRATGGIGGLGTGISVLPTIERQPAQNRLMQILSGNAPVIQQRGPRSPAGAQRIADVLQRRAAQTTPVYGVGDAMAALGNPIFAGLAQRRADTALENQRKRKLEAEQAKQKQYMGALASAIERAKEQQVEGEFEMGAGEPVMETQAAMGLADALLTSGNPQAAELGMKLKLQEVQQQAKPETFGAPTAAVDADGNPVFIRAGSQGGLQELEAYAPPPPTPASTPSAVQEYQFYQGLSDAGKEAYLRVKRSNRPIDRGGSLVVPSQTQPGAVAGEIPKTLAPSQEPETQAKQTTAKEQAKLAVEQEAARKEAEKALPKIEAETAQAVGIIERLVQHPGMQDVVGAPGSIAGAVAQMTGSNPGFGTDAAGFMALLKQIQGKQFLQAFENLKGGGQITEREGQAATDAMSRLGQTGQSEEEYLTAARELVSILNAGLERARAAARPQAAAAPAAAPAASQGGWSIEVIE